MTSLPIVSVCIPTFNSGSYIRDTLHSLKAQTLSDWELIVTDNGSNDETEAIVREFSKTVPQSVTFEENQFNLGLAGNRNAGISSASADWVALLDSDDLWLPDHLETCLQASRESGAELIHSGSILFDSDSGSYLSVRAPSSVNISELPLSLFGAYIIQPASVLMSHSLWSRVGGFDSSFVHGVEDLDMWLRCARAGAHIAYTGHETLLYRKHALALSTKHVIMSTEVARAFEKHLDWPEIPYNFISLHCARAWANAARLHWRAEPKIAAVQFRRACTLRWHPTWFFHGILCRFLTLMRITLSD